ncbi:MAG TPA: DUF4340 domain-containing protein [Polyangia bacterium]
MRRLRTLFVLAALAAILGALTFFDHRRLSTDERHQARGRLFPGFDRARIDSLRLTRGKSAVELVRKGDAWWIAAPSSLAEPTAVDAVLGELDFGQVERRISNADPALREKLGLRSPRATLEAGGRTFQIGGDAPDGSTVYVASSKDPDVLVVERRFFDVLDKSAEGWRSLRLTLTEPDQGHALAVGEVALERQGAGWALEKPIAARASTTRVDALLAAIDRARAHSARPGTFSGGEPILIDGVLQARLGGPCAGHSDQLEVARSDGLILCFASADLAPVRAGASSLRERRLFPLSLDEVDGVDVADESTHRTLELRRADAAWRIVAPLESAGPADDGAVRDWLSPLLALTASGHGPPGKTAITLRLRARGENITVELAPPEGGQVRALRQGEGDALLIPAPPAALLAPSPLQFRDRRIFNFRADDLSSLTIKERGAPSPADGAALDRFRDSLSELRADRFDPDASFTAIRTLRFTEAGSATARELSVGAADADGCLAETAGAPRFHLPAATCRALLSPMVRKVAPGPP